MKKSTKKVEFGFFEFLNGILGNFFGSFAESNINSFSCAANSFSYAADSKDNFENDTPDSTYHVILS